ncbi:SRPBCC family protein [Streptomyces sp. NPDC005180]|uniref:SRPBCC family protein n=1 Tax=Streptomyces sp. NPDC005180 TaxID=3156868 RepID=UPI0033B0C839
MEHQVFVPVPADDLRAVLRDPARLARCVPGLQQDADADAAAAGAVAGRLRLRVGSSSVTYRGTLRLAEREPGRFAVECEGAEARGHGTVKVSAVLRLSPHDGGTQLEFTGEAAADDDGRTSTFDHDTLTSAVHRLLDRLCANLTEAAEAVEDAEAPPASPGPLLGEGLPEAPDTPLGGAPGAPEVPDTPLGGDPEVPGVPDTPLGGVPEMPDLPEVPDLPGVPDFGGLSEIGGVPEVGGLGDADPTVPPNPPAEAAHARRTMIGRSAEEVDHAPPRGRYAPVPAPSAGGNGSALRWAAPAAALAVASVVVVGRALRRRR